MFSCYVTISQNICGSLTQLSGPFSDLSYRSHSSSRNTSYVFRNLSRYNRSRVCVVSWIVVRSLTRFATGDLLDRLILCAYIVLCVVNPKRPTVPVPPRITERIWIEVPGGGQFTRFPWILDRVHSIWESRGATSAAGTTRGSPRVGAAADRPFVGRAFESGVASRSAPD